MASTSKTTVAAAAGAAFLTAATSFVTPGAGSTSSHLRATAAASKPVEAEVGRSVGPAWPVYTAGPKQGPKPGSVGQWDTLNHF